MLLRLFTAAVVFAALTQTTIAGEKLVQKVYHVADLVVPMPDFDTPTKTGCPAPCPAATHAKTLESDLIKLIQYTVAPESWSSIGGPGGIEYYPPAYALVINNSPDVHEQIAGLLESIRKMQERQITFDVKFLSVSDIVFERIGVDFEGKSGCEACKAAQIKVRREHDPLRNLALAAHWQPQRSLLLNERQVTELMEALHGDQRANILTSPKMVTLDGQKAHFAIGQTPRFITDVKETKVNDQVVCMPVQSTEFIGTDMALQGSMTPDGKFVCVHVEGTITSLDPDIPLVPVTSMVTPIFEGGAQGQPVPFTQFIQKPRIEKVSVEKTLAIPNGGTALIDCGEMTTTTCCEYATPVLSKIPYVNRLFKNVGIGRENCHLVMLVTPRLLIGCGEEAAECNACAGGCLGTGVGKLIGSAASKGCCGTAKTAAQPQTKSCESHGSLTIGIGLNSDGRLQGSVILNERNFDTKCSHDDPACPMTDIVEMAKAGVSEDVIVNQIRTTNSRYSLTGQQIVWLHQNGVSERVIVEMQNTRSGANQSAATTLSQSAPQAKPNSEQDLERLNNIADGFAGIIGEVFGIKFVTEYSSDPNVPMHQLLNETDDFTQIAPEIKRFWMKNKPSTLSYDRLNGTVGP